MAKLILLELKNVLTYKETTINFTGGVNSFIGKSGTGKSHVIRALSCLLFGNPPISQLVSPWEGTTSIRALFEDGEIIRKKSKKFDGYILNGKEYSGFGRGSKNIPESIVKFINMEEINIQHQDDPPFFISMTPGKRGEYINQITDVEIITRTIKNSERRLNDTKNNIKSVKSTIKENKDKVRNEYGNIHQFELDVIELEEMKRKIEQRKEDLKVLEQNISLHKSADNRIAELNKVLSISPLVNKVLEKRNKIEDKKKIISTIDYLIGRLKTVEKKIKTTKSKLEKNKKEFNRLMPDKCPLCGK